MILGQVVFEIKVCEARMRSPLLGFRTDVQHIEFRRDPLTAKWSRINVERTKRVKQAVKGEEDLSGLISGSRKGCYFCQENLEEKTPLFPRDLVPEGRLRVGSSVLFPNLFPFGEYHAVATFSESHFLGLGEFSPQLVRDCLKNCLEFLRRVHAKTPEIGYCSINWNHMPPAAASIIHPHLQILADRSPTHYVEELIRKSEEYFRKNGSNYWSDLIDAERERKERLIAEIDEIVWLTSYAAQGNNEVVGIFSGISNVGMMRESHIEALSHGLSRVLRGYNDLGVRSFNMSVFSGPLNQDLKHYSLNLKVMSRPGLRALYTSDCGFMERFHDEPVVETLPEDLAGKLRRHFA